MTSWHLIAKLKSRVNVTNLERYEAATLDDTRPAKAFAMEE
jgi:hypothetical protein